MDPTADAFAALQAPWTQTWRDLALPPPDAAVLRGLLAAWSEPHRRYHAVQHLRECLALFAAHHALARHRGEVALAIWYHDAVYDTRRHDNEAASADWAARVLCEAGARDEVVERVRALVLATRHREVAVTPDEALLVDVDLAILGADAVRFAEYERQIRDEYAFVPEPLFREKRAEILRGFLARDALYLTPALAARLEAPARANLARAVRGLDAQGAW